MTTVDCRSKEGITIGLVDTILTAAHLLADRDLSGREVREALEDLLGDPELKTVLAAAANAERQNRAAETAAEIDWELAGSILWILVEATVIHHTDLPGHSWDDIAGQLLALARIGYVNYSHSLHTKDLLRFSFHAKITPLGRDYMEVGPGSRHEREGKNRGGFVMNFYPGKAENTAVGDPECMDCGLLYSEFGMDTTIPHSQWEKIHPGSEGGGILCANCMVKRAAMLEGKIAARMFFDFVPGKAAEQTGGEVVDWEIASEILLNIKDGLLRATDVPDLWYDQIVGQLKLLSRSGYVGSWSGWFPSSDGNFAFYVEPPSRRQEGDGERP